MRRLARLLRALARRLDPDVVHLHVQKDALYFAACRAVQHAEASWPAKHGEAKRHAVVAKLGKAFEASPREIALVIEAALHG